MHRYRLLNWLFIVCIMTAQAQTNSFAFKYRTPEKGDSLVTEAKTLLANQEFEEAIKKFRILIKQEPKNYQGYLGVAECLYYQNDYPNALNSVNAAISINSKAADAFRRRAKIHEKLHQYDIAIEDYTRAIALEPSTCLFLSDRSDVYARTGEYGKAIADLDKYLHLVKRPNPRIYYSRSILYSKMGKKAEADAERKRGDMIIDGAY